ncbi:MAG: glycosyltransferase [Verrucomicrobia bacterium]|nr:glycosyltransferase [Verrucomicrobiota bacterium]
MRFLFNTVYYKPARGGGGPIYSVSALAEELVRRGHEVTVVASDLDIPGRLDVRCDLEYEVEGVRVRYFWAKPTIIDSQISFTCSNGPCSRLARRYGKPYLYHQRGDLDPIRLKRGRLKKAVYMALVEKPIMRRARALIALTQREVESFRAVGLKNRVEVIPNGIDPPSLQKEGLRTSAETKCLVEGLGDAPVFLWMSRVHPVKGPQVFVDAFIRAAQRNPRLHGVIAGPDEVGMLSGLLSRVRGAGLTERFQYAGILHGDDKMALLQRADCFVFPTEAEGFSMVLLEALASGCAVLTSKGAYFDQIESAGAGRIVGCSGGDFADGILQMAALGRKGMADMGRKGMDLVRASYSWASIGRKYEALCQELVAANGAANRQ